MNTSDEISNKEVSIKLAAARKRWQNFDASTKKSNAVEELFVMANAAEMQESPLEISFGSVRSSVQWYFYKVK